MKADPYGMTAPQDGDVANRPDHDAALVSSLLGDVPLAGFFCAGELGPVGGKNFLHGFTASIAVFVEDDGRPEAARS